MGSGELCPIKLEQLQKLNFINGLILASILTSRLILEPDQLPHFFGYLCQTLQKNQVCQIVSQLRDCTGHLRLDALIIIIIIIVYLERLINLHAREVFLSMYIIKLLKG